MKAVVTNRSDPYAPVGSNARSPGLLTVANGTLDLRTGELKLGIDPSLNRLLPESDPARDYYDRAVARMNATFPKSPQLLQYKAEASSVLGIAE